MILGAAPPAHMWAATAFNPKGEFEPARVVEANDALLALEDRSWSDCRAIPGLSLGLDAQQVDLFSEVLRSEFPLEGLSVLKDPRVSVTLPYWDAAVREIGATAYYAVAIRDPLEVASSLARRDKFPIDRGLAVWMRYSLDAEVHTRGKRRAFVRNTDLLADPPKTLAALGTALGLEWLHDPEAMSGELDAFIERGLTHGSTSGASLLHGMAYDLYQALSDLADSGDQPGTFARIDALRQEFDGMASGRLLPFVQLETLERELAASRESALAARKQFDSDLLDAQRQIEAVRPLVEEFRKIVRRPWRPIKASFLGWLINSVARLSPPVPARTASRLRRSAAKRDLARLLPWSGPAGKRAGPHQAVRVKPAAAEVQRLQPRFISPNNQSVAGVKGRVGVHLHLADRAGFPELLEAVEVLGVPADVFVSVPEPVWSDALAGMAREAGAAGGRIAIRQVPAGTPGLMAMATAFGAELRGCDLVGHFVSDRGDAVAEAALAVLLRPSADGLSGGRTALQMLSAGEARLVSAERASVGLPAPEAGAEEAGRIIDAAGLKPGKGDVATPEAGMFWAEAKAAAPFLSAGQALAAAGAVSEDVMALVLARLADVPAGSHVELHRGDYPAFLPDYEEKRDYRGLVPRDGPKVLCYYLPQFHPTPENDAWHGAGFTEWTKVRGAEPLFLGHRQQRRPHPDIGYYLLDGTRVLRQQADLMRASGVHGMIFYHYWFSGRLILEKPAEALLADPGVEMPFCFCWANENWTRRWDGTESEVLLKQDYSAEDARAFIRHLMPFLRDPRYIRHEGRPLIFVYRPKLIPEDIPYVAIWQDACRAEGLPPPLVIGTLKDLATEVQSRGMEAAVERVLHDWTGGQVAPIDDTLGFFGAPAKGVIDYGEVAQYYRSIRPVADVPVIRSMVPCFDNTPRYGARANITHAPNLPDFEGWLRQLVREARGGSGIARDYVVINAWNEWAETAMVEPDTAFGYAYLNAIGRVLSGRSDASLAGAAPDGSIPVVRLEFADAVIASVRRDAALGGTAAARFAAGLTAAAVAGGVRLRTEAAEFAGLDGAGADGEAGSGREIRAVVRRLFVPNLRFFDRMVAALRSAPDEIVVPVWHGDGAEPMEPKPTSFGRIAREDAAKAPVLMEFADRRDTGRMLVRAAAGAFAALMPEDTGTGVARVDTVVRFHTGGNLALLGRALSSLAAQRDVAVTPVVMGQDLTATQVKQIEAMLDALPWREGIVPVLQSHASSPEARDLRSMLIRTGLGLGTARHAGFLDYDDLLFGDAYARLLERAKASGKAIVFGRTYRTFLHRDGNWIAWRDRHFERGRSYADFVSQNHAPIHSYLIDRTMVDLAAIDLPTDQKYMEDYLMLLQVVTAKNADWDGLSQMIYVGDYMHFDHGGNTVSVTDDTARSEIAKTPEYLRCEARITALQRELLAKFKARKE